MQGSTFLHHQYLALISCFLVCVMSNHTTQQNNYPRPTPTADSSDETRYPCGACDISVKWDQRAVACESCGQWFHLHCRDPDMNSTEHEDLGKSDATWHCVVCAKANYSSVAYDLFGLNTSQNVSQTHCNKCLGDGVTYPTRTVDEDAYSLLASRQRWMEEGGEESDGGYDNKAMDMA